MKKPFSSDENKKKFSKPFSIFAKILAYFEELVFEHRLFGNRGCDQTFVTTPHSFKFWIQKMLLFPNLLTQKRTTHFASYD
ncbi:hypothetical protein F6X86_13765 [Enterococcus durans]|uniref:Uncharacterized protein n=1 Tax=Enterococcus durans TaxID=53345 RepID=A0A5N0YNQ6_9ENTE|nr:hypothetical protein F6X86_13765 [Enterococcus durans]KAA9183430.1 hypothetical protein F6X90_13985 [Enterococcus durans]KAA9187600.1 hypothetical protein F6Y12_13975 [Enterococcus durans]KAA9187960.1 hypothetical protein F6X85_01915 [Enterococcus durans]KAA9190041.1 hypothetical protein F6X88_13905 [Enterococcus durans]